MKNRKEKKEEGREKVNCSLKRIIMMIITMFKNE
jgi:hypothetical protein